MDFIPTSIPLEYVLIPFAFLLQWIAVLIDLSVWLWLSMFILGFALAVLGGFYIGLGWGL